MKKQKKMKRVLEIVMLAHEGARLQVVLVAPHKTFLQKAGDE